MASLTLAQPQKVGYGTWRYTYSGTAPFRRFVDGAQVLKHDDVEEGKSNDTYVIVSDMDDDLEPPVVEVYDSTDLTSIPLQFENASRNVLQWRGSQNDEVYLVEYWDGDSWEEPDYPYVKATGVGYYQYVTPFAQSGETVWRVTAQQLDGSESVAVEYTVVLIPNPAPPSISISYAAGTGLLTVAAR